MKFTPTHAKIFLNVAESFNLKKMTNAEKKWWSQFEPDFWEALVALNEFADVDEGEG